MSKISEKGTFLFSTKLLLYNVTVFLCVCTFFFFFYPHGITQHFRPSCPSHEGHRIRLWQAITRSRWSLNWFRNCFICWLYAICFCIFLYSTNAVALSMICLSFCFAISVCEVSLCLKPLFFCVIIWICAKSFVTAASSTTCDSVLRTDDEDLSKL